MQIMKGYTIHPDATFNKQGLSVGWEYALSADHQFFLSTSFTCQDNYSCMSL